MLIVLFVLSLSLYSPHKLHKPIIVHKLICFCLCSIVSFLSSSQLVCLFAYWFINYVKCSSSKSWVCVKKVHSRKCHFLSLHLFLSFDLIFTYLVMITRLISFFYLEFLFGQMNGYMYSSLFLLHSYTKCVAYFFILLLLEIYNLSWESLHKVFLHSLL